METLEVGSVIISKEYRDITFIKSNQYDGYLCLSNKTNRRLGDIRYFPQKKNYYFIPTGANPLGQSIIKSIDEFMGLIKKEIKNDAKR
jgi:hypothetical protein